MPEPDPVPHPPPAQVQWIEPGLRCVLAPNPSPMTHWGTNTYLLGRGSVAVIDPGPALPAHQAAILAALQPGERITHILVTHAHLDHSPLAAPLAEVTGAKVLAFGPARHGLSPRMAGLEGLEGGEGLDLTFAPHHRLEDGDRVEADDWAVTALHTPGHLAGHLCFAWGDRLFTGDHVMGWAPSLVSPPEGDMTDYLASLHRLTQTTWARFYPAHGAAVTDPADRLAALLSHRRMREAAILEALHHPADLETLLRQVYAATPTPLIPAARRNLLAHLVDLVHRKEIIHSQASLTEARFHRR